MIMILTFALFLFVIGVSLLLAPNQLARLSQFLNQKVFDDTAVLSHRILLAIICLGLGALMFWMAFGHNLFK